MTGQLFGDMIAQGLLYGGIVSFIGLGIGAAIDLIKTFGGIR